MLLNSFPDQWEAKQGLVSALVFLLQQDKSNTLYYWQK